ncbi:MAG TPA: M48 family metalloprotease [Alphaproteobacteria bacterium]|nr:M48 family metalloprotease [Alphaproteobacteria bacterium]
MALSNNGLTTSRWNARNKSVVLMALFPPIVSIAAYWQIYFIYVVFNRREMAYVAHPNFTPRVDNVFWMIFPFLLLALAIWFVVCLKQHDEIIAGLFRAKEIERRDNPDLYNMVETLAIQLGKSMPEIFVIETFARNAFASTLKDGTDRIYVTTGLLESLSRDEVEAVLAHEYAHILGEDTRWISLSIIFTNIFAALPNATTKHDKFGNFSRMSKEKIAIDVQLFFLNLIFLPIWIGFTAISLVRLFIMFEREHQADLMAVEITKNPDALMRAFIRIHRRARIPHISSDVMFLCIDNPRGGFFATHPRMFNRLRFIARQSNTEIPEIETSSMAPIHKRLVKNKLLERAFRPRKGKPDKPWG